MHHLVAFALFPAVLCGTVAWGLIRIEAGAVPAEAVAPPIASAYLLIALAERFFAWERDWLHSKGDLRVDIGHFLVSGLLTIQLLEVPIRIAAIAAAGWLANRIGGVFWPGQWPLLAQLALALVVGEFFMYWIHRLTHEVDFLWRFHALHHSAPRLYFLNAVRFHPIDIALSNFSPMVPLILLGADARVLALFGLFSAVNGLFQHANLTFYLGPFNWLFSQAELHRWHHSRRLEESNTNFGQNLIIWDVVFGTRYLPPDREPPRQIGLHGLPNFPMNYWGQLLSPLRWKSIVAAEKPR